MGLQNYYALDSEEEGKAAGCWFYDTARDIGAGVIIEGGGGFEGTHDTVKGATFAASAVPARLGLRGLRLCQTSGQAKALQERPLGARRTSS